jgi:Xaa-Pro aminopeptidase
MSQFLRRQEAIQTAVLQAGLDALVVGKVVNVSYLTGFTGDSSFLIVTPARVLLISDTRFTIQIEEECPALEVHIRRHNRNSYQAIVQVLEQLGIRNAGLEASGFNLAEAEMLKRLAPTVNFTPQGGYIEKCRVLKDAAELQQIRYAIAIAEQGFRSLLPTLKPTTTEKEIFDDLEWLLRKAGGRSSAFPIIPGVGARAALPHANPTAKKLSEAPFLLLDWGARGPGLGYMSDLTRVLRTPDEPGTDWPAAVESTWEKIYTVVLQAQLRAAAKLRDGVQVREVDTAARGYIEEAGYGEYFNHGLGHGFGLEIHEAPSIRANSEDTLRAGMVVTIEPGIYLPGVAGVRIEDDYLITESGAERLTSLPREWDWVRTLENR